MPGGYEKSIELEHWPIWSTGHSGGINILLGDGSVRYGADLTQIVNSIVSRPPAGIIAILIGLAVAPGWNTANASRHLRSRSGHLLLIGLSSAEMLKVRGGAGGAVPDLSRLAGALGPGVDVYVADDQGRWSRVATGGSMRTR